MDVVNNIAERLNYISIQFADNEIKPKVYMCNVCKDTHFVNVGDDYFKQCECRIVAINEQRLKESGLLNLDNYSFENYVTEKQFQKIIFDKAQRFLEQDTYKFFFIAGQTGCGKTHICTAICTLLSKSKRVKYEKYLTLITRLKQLRFGNENEVEYVKLLEQLKTIDVLYIDDLLKTKANNDVTKADLEIIFEIIDYRYCNNLITIISSETTLNEIIQIDEALAGRIVEKAGEFTINISKGIEKNYRLKDIVNL